MSWCTQCGVYLPGDKKELEDRLWQEQSILDASILDEWFCPDCNYCYIHIWRLHEVLWYENDFLDDESTKTEIDESDNSQFFVCCLEWHVDKCDCQLSYSFNDGMETLAQINLDPEDLYRLRGDNLDCSSCDLMGSISCLPFTKALGEFITTGRGNSGITVCPDYQYDSTRESTYKYKRATSDLMAQEISILATSY